MFLLSSIILVMLLVLFKNNDIQYIFGLYKDKALCLYEIQFT